LGEPFETDDILHKFFNCVRKSLRMTYHNESACPKRRWSKTYPRTWRRKNKCWNFLIPIDIVQFEAPAILRHHLTSREISCQTLFTYSFSNSPL